MNKSASKSSFPQGKRTWLNLAAQHLIPIYLIGKLNKKFQPAPANNYNTKSIIQKLFQITTLVGPDSVSEPLFLQNTPLR
jgi:hypothetical protein